MAIVISAIVFLIFVVGLVLWHRSEMRSMDEDMQRLVDAMGMSHRAGLAKLHESSFGLKAPQKPSGFED